MPDGHLRPRSPGRRTRAGAVTGKSRFDTRRVGRILCGMATASSRAAIVRAIAGNGFVTLAKFVAWSLTGSGAMLAEGIHSLVDTLNQGLLLIGNRRSLLAPTARYPYGFGPEASFWGLLAAIGILVFGGGLSIQHGIHGLAHPELPQNLGVALGVLALSTAIESWVLYTVIRDLVRTRRGKRWAAHLSAQPPGMLTVLLEDAAAVLGCLVAAAALGLCQLTGEGVYDALAQLVIGTMLAAVGLYLIWKNRGMLIGQALEPAEVQRLRVFLEDQDGIDRVTALKTRKLSANQFTLRAEVIFSGGELAQRLVGEFSEPLHQAATRGEAAETLGRFADRLMLEQARHVDSLEAAIRRAYPRVADIDLEPHLRDI